MMNPTTPFPHIIYTYARAICIFFVASFMLPAPVKAQTVVANRVKAAASSLPNDCRIVAKYTDNQRHCLYYIANDRLYKYDVLTNKNSDIRFSPNAYSRIIKTYVTENGDYLFVCVDKDLNAKEPPENVQELWRVNPSNNRSIKIGEGFSIKRVKDGFVIKELVDKKTSRSGDENSQWTVRDHHFYADGQSKWAEEEYTFSK